MIVGSQGPYQWLTSVDHDMSHLIRLCPEVLLDKYAAITSIDSGELRLTEVEKSLGWWTSPEGLLYQTQPDGDRVPRGGYVAYSPRLSSLQAFRLVRIVSVSHDVHDQSRNSAVPRP